MSKKRFVLVPSCILWLIDWPCRFWTQFCSLCSGQNTRKRRWAPQYPGQGHLPSSLTFLHYVSLSKDPLLPSCETVWGSGLWIAQIQMTALTCFVCLPHLETIIPVCGPSSQTWSSIPFSLFCTVSTTLENPLNFSISLSAGSLTKYCKLGDFCFSEHPLFLAVWKAGSLSKEFRSSEDSSICRALISYEILTRKKMDSQYSVSEGY